MGVLGNFVPSCKEPQYIIKQIGQAKRNKTSMVFIMIDVDNFKRVNDHFGHETGDYVLSRLGNLLPSLVREGDLTCRYGGEEFLFVLLNCDLNLLKRWLLFKRIN